MIILYKTDKNHSFNSRRVLGVAEDFKNLHQLIKEQARKEGNKLSFPQMINLLSEQKTKGYEGQGEFMIKGIKINTLI